MTDYIEVDTLALDRDRKTIQSELQKAKKEIGHLEEEMTVLSSMWNGPAHDMFMAQFRADYEFMEQFEKDIAFYTETMQYALNEYRKCEESVEQAVAAIKI